MIPGAEARYRLGERKPVKVKKRPEKSSRPGREKTSDPTVTGPSTPDTTFVNESEVIFDLSRRFGIAVERIRYLRNVRWGYNDLVRALIIARESQVEPGRLLKLRLAGSTWESIADGVFVSATKMEREARELINAIRVSLPEAAVTEKPQTWEEKAP